MLVLEDGEVFEGVTFGAPVEAFGEVVFNTGMCGYQEVLTDPSYQGQIVTMTYPHVGNYGVNREDVESRWPRVAGFVIRDLPPRWSSWRGEASLSDYLAEHEIAAITEVDTRRLTRHIRDKGAMRGAISAAEADPARMVSRVREIPEMIGLDLVVEVSTTEPYEWPCEDPQFEVAAYDYGIKFNILRLLSAHGCRVTVYPAKTPAAEILRSNPDGVFLSNGPGDPEAVEYGVRAVGELLGKVPVFGICLGHQLLGRAVGLDTYKLKFGHRGVNHPVLKLADGSIEITTQNHGFAVEAGPFGFDPPDRPGRPLPEGLVADGEFGKIELTHVNLNDYTVEGFSLVEAPAFSVQYHPEAGPGPHDARYLFDEFIRMMDTRANTGLATHERKEESNGTR
ncbi:MAG: glutamine-hydrolyzing carbamoyl-phosphate synthase small subunit [Actinomycetota bacterium]